MRFDNESIERLREQIKAKLSEKRYIHTLGVERLTRHLGKILLPDKINELTAAALLHDIAKELSFEEHVKLLEGSDVEYTEEDLSVKPALHSIAAIPLIDRDFGQFSTDEIRSSVANHTLGAPKMSVFDEIVFISDYAEDGRTYRACIEVREYLLDNIKAENSFDDNILALHKASLMSIVFTVESLQKRGDQINSRTLETKRYFEGIINI